MRLVRWASVVLLLYISWQPTYSFQSDELSELEDEWGIVGGSSAGKAAPGKSSAEFVKSSNIGGAGSNSGGSERYRVTAPSVDRKVQFLLEHSFGDSKFTPAGLFTARLRETIKGGQTLSKFRLTRDPFSEEEKIKFQELLDTDGLYTIRVPSNVVNPEEGFVLSSVKARCLVLSGLQERFDFHMDQGHIIGVTYGGSLNCPYPRPMQTPSQWTFDSSIIIKTSQAAPRTLLAPEVVELAEEEDHILDGASVKKIPEKSFWAKYWLYIVPLGLILVNAITQVANMPEEGAPAATDLASNGVQQRAIGAGGARRR